MHSLLLKLTFAKFRVIFFRANLGVFTALITLLLFYFFGTILWISCDDNPTDNGGWHINPPLPIVSYHSPIWHPSGEFIGFNHIPIKSLHYVEESKYPDRWELESDSIGFWLINADGTNMRRIFPTQLQTPAWSPDGDWVAFVSGGQIFKMRFTGNAFDTTTITQLTFEGRNFFPAWSPDGQWIAYDISLADSNGSTGIWRMKFDGGTKQALFGAAIPSWYPNGNIIIGSIGTTPTDIWTRFVRYSVLMHQNVDTLSAIIGNENLYPRFSPDGTKIAFASQPLNSQVNLWLMDSTGGNLQQLTTEGMSDNSGLPFSWNPTENIIIFTQYCFDEWPPQNGTLWILDVNTGQKHQLTFNPQPVK
jgi:TolB protein